MGSWVRAWERGYILGVYIHVVYFSCSLVDFVERSLDMYRVSLYTWLPDFIYVISFQILMHEPGNEVWSLHTIRMRSAWSKMV